MGANSRLGANSNKYGILIVNIFIFEMASVIRLVVSCGLLANINVAVNLHCIETRQILTMMMIIMTMMNQ